MEKLEEAQATLAPAPSASASSEPVRDAVGREDDGFVDGVGDQHGRGGALAPDPLQFEVHALAGQR